MKNKSLDHNSKPIVFALIGPTCTYKSSIGIDLASSSSSEYPFEIISADSRLVYKGMDIGTSKPSLEERKNIPHYMIDLVEPGIDYSVGLYKKDAERKIKEIFSKNKIPLFVGGTGLYLNSVLLGLSIPEVKPDVSFRRQLKSLSQEDLYLRLMRIDPKACEKIHKNDNFRTVRALEVIYKTNKLFSSLKSYVKLPFKVIWIGLTYENRDLHFERIKKRTYNFCKDGFVEEVRRLLDTYGEIDLFKRTIGYSEAIDFLKHKIKLTEMVEKITMHTKQFSKRQKTWFRANKEIKWIPLDDLSYKDALERAFSLIEEGSFANTSMVSIS